MPAVTLSTAVSAEAVASSVIIDIPTTADDSDRAAVMGDGCEINVRLSSLHSIGYRKVGDGALDMC